MSDWALLRQVVMATDDIEGDGALLRERLRLGKGFADPELATIGMADDTLPLAGGSYLELVGPLADDSSLARWLRKIGGRGGYALSVQHNDPIGVRDRALARGVRVVADLEVMGHPVIQLHPADVGLLLELDGITDRDQWFWDDLGVVPEPDGRVADVVSVRVGVADPSGTAALWNELLGLSPATAAATVDLGGRLVEFVRLSEAPQWTVTVTRSEHGVDLVDERLAGVDLRYV